VDNSSAMIRARGMRELVEPRVRHLVADHLAVDGRALGESVSIRDDLAADSLDLLELALLLEREFGVVISDRVVDAMRSYGDVVDGIVRLVVARSTRESRDGCAAQSPQVRACLVGPGTASGGRCHWAGALTGYMAETLAEAAQQAGSGSRLEILVGAETTAATLAVVQGHFVRTRARAIDVVVGRSGEAAPRWTARREMPPA